MKTNLINNLTNIHNITNKRFVLYILLAVCIAWSLWLRIPYIGVPILIVDEALYAEIANVILDGGLPYRDAWEQKPPAIYYLYASIFALFGRNNLTAVHWTAAITVAMTCLGLFLMISSISTKIVAIISAFFYATLSSAGQASHFQAANTEIFSVFFCVWALYIFLRKPSSNISIFISGALICAGFFFKQPAGMFLPVIILHVFFTPGNTLPVRIKQSLILISGFISATLPVILYFMFHNALDDFIMVGFWHNILYMKDNDLRYGFYAAKNNISVFTKGNTVFYAPSILMFFYSLCRISKRTVAGLPVLTADRLYAIWYPASWVCVALGWRFEGHYFFFALPAVAALSAHWWTCAFYNLSHKAMKGRIRAWLILALFAFGLFTCIKTHLGWSFTLERSYFVTLDPLKQKQTFIYHIAKYIYTNTTSSDKIFVWGFCPEIYILSNRRTASRFIFCNFLIGQMTGDKYYYYDRQRFDRIIPGSWDKLMDDLHKNFPKFVIDTAPSNYFKYGKYPVTRFERLKTFLDKYYTYIGQISGTDVYKLDEKKFQHTTSQ
ncbi:MAG: glycosyltransferase family 39 protein [Candidatus Auribacterota bacterium]|jgi:hypothetical protein|nr:glycosyltransferase family 39 protein [Candidatus Auribacterota bacterium]